MLARNEAVTIPTGPIIPTTGTLSAEQFTAIIEAELRTLLTQGLLDDALEIDSEEHGDPGRERIVRFVRSVQPDPLHILVPWAKINGNPEFQRLAYDQYVTGTTWDGWDLRWLVECCTVDRQYGVVVELGFQGDVEQEDEAA